MLLLLPLYGFKVEADGSFLVSGEDDATASETALRRSEKGTMRRHNTHEFSERRNKKKTKTEVSQREPLG